MAFYDNITLEKGMYNTSFTKALEKLDPSGNYKGSALDGLDAYERQLKRFDIKVNGYNSDSVSKFFETSNSAVLFPEYVKRAVLQGINESNVLNDIIATKTKINSMDYRPIAAITSSDEKELKKVAEGAAIPSTQIKVQENLVNLYKRGRMLVSSYEAIKFERLDLFTVTLKQIGAYIAKSQLSDAMNVIMNGDGNNNAAESITTSATQLSYDDLINLWAKFDDYELNRMLVSTPMMKQLLAIAELKNPTTGLNFQATGKLTTPLGATLYKTNCLPANTIVGLDKNCALEMVTACEVNIEHDKLIDRQLERAAITSIAGFAKIFKDASKVLTLKA